MMPADQLIEQLLALSKTDGLQVIVQDTTSMNLRWANNTPTTNGQTTNREVVIIAHDGKRVGTTTHTNLALSDLETALRVSEATARTSAEAEDYEPLLAPSQMPGEDWRAPAGELSASVLGDFAKKLRVGIDTAKASDTLLFGFAEQAVSTVYLGTSAGQRLRHEQWRGQIEITAKSPDFKRSAWAGSAASRLDQIDLTPLLGKLAKRLDWSKTSIELPAGLYETILEPSAVADLLIYAYWTTMARDADEGRTVYSKKTGGSRIGETLGAKGATLYSDPAEPGLGVAPFQVAGASSSAGSVFDNGAALARTSWLTDGVLTNLIRPRFWAHQTKTEPQPYIDNLIFPAEGQDLDELIAGTKRGLLVTCLWYIREVDPSRLLLTGLTRDGVFLIEDGQVKGAVSNYRFNMSPIEMLAQIKTIGQSEATLAREWGDYFAFSKMPPLVISDFNMSSISQAR